MTAHRPGARGRWRAALRPAAAPGVPAASAVTGAVEGEDRDPRGGTLARARELAATSGRAEEALAAYRSAVGSSGTAPSVLLEYARFLVGQSRGSSAEEVLALVLAQEGASIDALELYLDLVRELDLPVQRSVWAFGRLTEDVAASPASHRGALDYAIPHRLAGVLAAVAAGGDPVSRAIVAVNALHAEGTPAESAVQEALDGLGRNDAMRVRITVALGRGNRTLATALLEEADPAAVPVNALRRAVRRARAAGKDAQLDDYLRAYLRVRPGDGWATGLTEERSRRAVSNYQLGRTGFPFPPARDVPAYEVRRDHVFYLLHNSLPHHSAGYATRTHGLLTALNRSGWDVDGVTRLGYPYDMPGKADLPDVLPSETIGEVDYRRLLAGREIERKNPLYPYTERYATALADLARRERPAVLHAASNHWNGLTAVRTARELGIPSVYEVRGLWEVTRGSRDPEWARSSMFRFMARMEADAARTATRVFAITEALREELITRGVDGDTITVVPNGVDTTRFTPLPRDEELASRLGVGGRTVIGYVGSVLDYEGIELLIEAARELGRSRDDFHVLVVGDGAELDRFRTLALEHELEHLVTFTGRVPHEEVERYYSIIDITPFPRLPLPVCEMVSPLKPFEAMAMGKAVVASDVAALQEIVQPGLNGLLHAKGDTEALTEQLRRLLDDRELTATLGRQAREWVVEHRDWARIARVIAGAYEELVR